MSDRTSASPMTVSAAARPGRLANIAVALALGLGLAGIGAFATTSFSQGFGPPFGHGYWHGLGYWHGGPFGGGLDPARAEERADVLDRVLDDTAQLFLLLGGGVDLDRFSRV